MSYIIVSEIELSTSSKQCRDLAETVATKNTGSEKLDLLDGNCMELIFSFLPLSDVVKSQLVCHKWRATIRSSAAIWKNHLLTLLHSHPDFDCRQLLRLLDAWKGKERWEDHDLETLEDFEGNSTAESSVKGESIDLIDFCGDVQPNANSNNIGRSDGVIPEKDHSVSNVDDGGDDATNVKEKNIQDVETCDNEAQHERMNAEIKNDKASEIEVQARVDAESENVEDAIEADVAAYAAAMVAPKPEVVPEAALPQASVDIPEEAVEPADSDESLSLFLDSVTFNSPRDTDHGRWIHTRGLTRPVVKIQKYKDIVQYNKKVQNRLLHATTTNPRLIRQLVMTMRRMILKATGTASMTKCRQIIKDYPRDDLILHAIVNDEKRVLAFSPFDSTKIFILDLVYLKHVAVIDLVDHQMEENLLSFRHFMSFNGDFIYVCLNGVIHVWNWTTGVWIREIFPVLEDNWRIYPVFSKRFLCALDQQLIYVFDVSVPDRPRIRHFYVPDDEGYPVHRYPWTSVHIMDGLVVGHRNLIVKDNYALSAHAFYFWSVDDGILVKKHIFSHSDFLSLPFTKFSSSSIKFIGRCAFLIAPDSTMRL